MESGVIETSTLSGPLVEIVSVKSLCSRDACITEIHTVLQGQDVIVQGTSRRSPEDKHVPEIARLISMERALQSISNKVKRRAEGLMIHHENIALQRPLQLKKAEEWRANRQRLIVQSNDKDERTRRHALRELRQTEGTWDVREPDVVVASKPTTSAGKPSKAGGSAKKNRGSKHHTSSKGIRK